MKILATFQDRPSVVTATLVGSTLAYQLVMRLLGVQEPLAALLRDAESGVGVAISLGLSSVAVTAAGFVGVIVVFGLGQDSEVLFRFRLAAGASMRANWISVIGCAFAAALVGLGAALAVSAAHYGLSSGLLIIGLALLGHSIARTLWLFGVLIRVITVGDETRDRNRRTPTLHEIFGRGAA